MPSWACGAWLCINGMCLRAHAGVWQPLPTFRNPRMPTRPPVRVTCAVWSTFAEAWPCSSLTCDAGRAAAEPQSRTMTANASRASIRRDRFIATLIQGDSYCGVCVFARIPAQRQHSMSVARPPDTASLAAQQQRESGELGKKPMPLRRTVAVATVATQCNCKSYQPSG